MFYDLRHFFAYYLFLETTHVHSKAQLIPSVSLQFLVFVNNYLTTSERRNDNALLYSTVPVGSVAPIIAILNDERCFNTLAT